MATHSSILAWKIPWTEEPGRLQSMRPQRVRHDWVTNTCPFPSSYYLVSKYILTIPPTLGSNCLSKGLAKVFFFSFFLLTEIFENLLKWLWALKTPRKTFLFIWSAINFGSWHCQSAWAVVNNCHLAERAGFPNCSSWHSINSNEWRSTECHSGHANPRVCHHVAGLWNSRHSIKRQGCVLNQGKQNSHKPLLLLPQ